MASTFAGNLTLLGLGGQHHRRRAGPRGGWPAVLRVSARGISPGAVDHGGGDRVAAAWSTACDGDAPVTEVAQDPQRRWPRWLGVLAKGLGFAAGLLFLATFLVPLAVRGPRFAAAVRQLVPPLEGTLRIEGGGLGAGAFWAYVFGRPVPVRLEGLSVLDPEGVEVFRSARLTTSVEFQRAPLRVFLHDLRPGKSLWRFARMKSRRGVGFLAAFRPKQVAPPASPPTLTPMPTPAPQPRPERSQPFKAAFGIASAHLDGLDAHFDFWGWGLELADIRATGFLRIELGTGRPPITFDAREVDARAGGFLRILGDEQATVIPFDRAAIERVGTPADGAANLRVDRDRRDDRGLEVVGQGAFSQPVSRPPPRIVARPGGRCHLGQGRRRVDRGRGLARSARSANDRARGAPARQGDQLVPRHRRQLLHLRHRSVLPGLARGQPGLRSVAGGAPAAHVARQPALLGAGRRQRQGGRDAGQGRRGSLRSDGRQLRHRRRVAALLAALAGRHRDRGAVAAGELARAQRQPGRPRSQPGSNPARAVPATPAPGGRAGGLARGADGAGRARAGRAGPVPGAPGQGQLRTRSAGGGAHRGGVVRGRGAGGADEVVVAAPARRGAGRRRGWSWRWR